MPDPHIPNADLEPDKDAPFSHNPLTPAAEVDSMEGFDIEAEASGSPGREGGTTG